jgi:hypothetical protein
MDNKEEIKVPETIKVYREQVTKGKEWLKANYNCTKKGRHKKNKSPWYMMTKGKCFNYQEKQEEWGANATYYKVDSMSKKLNLRLQHRKMNREQYIELLIEAKLKDWDKAHPRPIKRDDQQPDLFESTFIPQWVSDRGAARERIESEIRTKYDKVQVFARFELSEGVFTDNAGDAGGVKGYPIYCGAIKDYHGEYRKLYNILTATSKEHLFKRTKVVSMAQKIANNLQKLYPAKDKDGNRLYPRFVGIQFYFGDRTCPKILLPE